MNKVIGQNNKYKKDKMLEEPCLERKAWPTLSPASPQVYIS